MNDKRRVRHLLKGLGPGGAERLVSTQALNTGDQWTPEVVYLLAWKDHLVPELKGAGIATRCLDARGGIRLGWVRRLRRLLRDDPTEVLHIHSPAVASVVRLLIRTLPRRGRPAVVVTEHNRWPRHHRVTRLANRLTIASSDAVLAVSKDVKSTIDGIDASRVRVIEHGIDLDLVRQAGAREEVRRELGVSEKDVLVVCVANLRREKSLDLLIEAAGMALSESANLRYVLVGQGPLADDVDRWISDADLGGNFVALGYRADATRVMSAADVFTLSSTHEGLPVAVMEALALGIPVAATDAGGVAPAVGDAGVITPVGDAAALARSHVQLAADPTWRDSLARAAVLQSERFSIQRAEAEIEQIYATVTTGAALRDNR